jgi:hypothetical protein
MGNHQGPGILQFPEDFFIFQTGLDIDNLADRFIMGSVKDLFVFCVVKGVSAEKQTWGKTL